MSITNVQPVQDSPHSGGGGLWGTIGAAIGGAAALIAAPFTFGATTPAAIASGAALVGTGVALGETAGTIAGNIDDPASGGSVSDVVPNQVAAPLRTMASQHPEVQLAQLQDAHNAINESIMPQGQANHAIQQISQAKNVLQQRLGIGR